MGGAFCVFSRFTIWRLPCFSSWKRILFGPDRPSICRFLPITFPTCSTFRTGFPFGITGSTRRASSATSGALRSKSSSTWFGRSSCGISRERSVARLCGLALILSLIVRTALVAHYGSGIWVYAFTITRADGLWVGSGLAALYALHGQFPAGLCGSSAGLGLLFLGAIVVLRPINQLWLTGTYMSMIGITGVACLSGALLVLALRPEKTRLGGLLQMPWLRSVWQI